MELLIKPTLQHGGNHSAGQVLGHSYFLWEQTSQSEHLGHFRRKYFINNDLVEGDSAFCQPQETLLTEAPVFFEG